MLNCTRIHTDDQGAARFEDTRIPMVPEEPGPDTLSVSEVFGASGLIFARAVPGGGHPDQPEPRRAMGIVLAGSSEISASGETRTFTTGDILLIEDTEGVGHSSRTTDGFLVALAILDPPR